MPRGSADSAALVAATAAFLGDLQGTKSRCNGQADLELRIAFGNGYELLDWLDSDALDAAVLEDSAIAVLEHGRNHGRAIGAQRNAWLREIELPPAVTALLPAGGATTWGSVAEDGLQAVSLESLLAGLAAGREDLRISTPWHLDGAYVELLSAARRQQAANPRAAGPDPGRPDPAIDFWHRLLDATEITLEVDGATPPVPRRLVMPFPFASRLWQSSVIEEHGARLPEDLAALLQGDAPPPALAPLFEISDSFGTRPFTFRLGESLELLRLQPEPSLALVLPGGGVKAAYQSRLVDHLYSTGKLHNRDHPGGAESLPVNAVVGTSGGALLGYFVARLGEKGPWNLTELLWQTGPDRYLTSGDIFPGGDMLRYASVLVSFLIFSALLLFASFPQGSPLHPEGRAENHYTWRTRLTFGAAWFLFVIPLLVKAIHSDDLREHIPEIEGLIFALATFLAVSADQLIIRRPGARLPQIRGSRWPALILLATGAGLTALPFLLGEDWRDRPAAFGLAFAALYLLLIVATVALLRVRRPQAPWTLRRALAFALEAVVAAALVMLFHHSLGKIFDKWSEAGIVFSGFLLVALVLVATDSLPQRFARAGEDTTAFAYLLLFSLVIFSLARPQETRAGLPPLMEPSRLDLPLGALWVSFGAVLFFAGLIGLVHASDGRYRLVDRRGFFNALLMAVIHILLVHGTLFVMSRRDFSMLELTGAFWLRLAIVAAVAAFLMIAIAWRLPESGLGQGLRYLASFHPNGTLVHRRLSRFGGIALLAFVWWNLTVAPALYGNRQANAYLAGAIARFDAAPEQQESDDPEDVGKTRVVLTTDFIVPTNVLDDSADGTRLFLFSDGGPRDISPPIGSGAQWSAIGTDFVRQPRAVGPRADRDGILFDRRVLEKVIMASGSPFPIFPATHVAGLPGRPEEEAMVDGGFSNLVPVEAAGIAGARQVLILHSTHPMGHGTQAIAALTPPEIRPKPVRGELFRNLGRLPGYLFERSQRIDRVRRRELLVVSLAPLQSHPEWPPLFDFRESTVERMTQTAKDDLGRRLGFVESWGQPRFTETLPLGRP